MECAFRRQNKHTIRRCQRTRIAMLINQHSNSSLYREQQPFPNSISGQDCRAAKVEPICLLAIRRMHIYRRWLSYATAHMNELCKFEEGKKKNNITLICMPWKIVLWQQEIYGCSWLLPARQPQHQHYPTHHTHMRCLGSVYFFFFFFFELALV